MRPDCGWAMTRRARLPAFAVARKEAKKLPFELKCARLPIKRAPFSVEPKTFQFKYNRANSKRIQGVFRRIHAAFRNA